MGGGYAHAYSKSHAQYALEFNFYQLNLLQTIILSRLNKAFLC